MTDLFLVSSVPDDVDVLVVGVAQTDDGARVLDVPGLPFPAASLDPLLGPLGVTGAAGTTARVPAPEGSGVPVLLVVGLGAHAAGTGPGEGRTPDDEALRRAAGTATRTLGGTSAAALALPTGTPEATAAVLEGALLGAYAFTRYRSSGATAALARVDVVVPDAADPATVAAAERARVVAASVALARDLVNTSPNELYPESFADRAAEAVAATGVEVEVLDDAALRAGGYGGLVGVGQGSQRGPRLVRLGYRPQGATGSVALVGKGITFDSGGISIKPAAGMDAMKSDMAGAAAVLGTVLAAARLGLPVGVTGWLCLAENLPSGTAQRPGDVVTIRGGTTVEILNTDAEGRLVMADGLVAAREQEPDVVLDVATLTGAQMVALGRRISAVMGTDAVREEVVAAAGRAGEEFWPMPLPAELREGLSSKVADIANAGERYGGMLTAGIFLREFTGETPWAHLDIAGPAFNEKAPFGYTPAGGTGVAVRTLLAFCEARAGR